MSSKDYVNVANSYIDGVLNGQIITGRLVKLACKRQQRDLERFSRQNSPYYFDEAEANRVCSFIELLPHTKGVLAGKKIHLEPWQVFILTTVFGWKKSENGARRYRSAYIEVARGNGKSAISSGVMLYCLLADRELGAEVYAFATTHDQALIVYDSAATMARWCKPMTQKFGLKITAHSMLVPSTNSVCRAKSSDGKTLDGLNTHLAIVDELHAHKTRDLYDVVETSLGKRPSSLLWCITTAGSNVHGICFEVRSMTRHVLEGVVEDESQFGIIYTIDDGDDWTSEEAIIKANPNWKISVDPDRILSLQKQAQVKPAAKTNFLTKHLNVWCKASSLWMNMEKWNECGRDDLRLEDYEGRECFIGLDLSAKSDIAAKVYLFREEDGSITVFPRFYLSRMALERNGASVINYGTWAEKGYLTVAGDVITDFTQIQAELEQDLTRFSVSAIAYDPWNAQQLAMTLSDMGAPMVEYRNTVQNMSEPMKELEALIHGGLVNHPNDPVLTWMMGNVEARIDFKDNIFPRKADMLRENKIDGVVAMIFALGVTKRVTPAFVDYEPVDNPFEQFEW